MQNHKSSTKIEEEKKSKSNNKHHQSIPMVPSASKGKLNLGLLQDSWQYLLP